MRLSLAGLMYQLTRKWDPWVKDRQEDKGMGLITECHTKPFAWQDAEYVGLSFYAGNHCCPSLALWYLLQVLPPSLVLVPVLFLTLTKLASHFLQACAATSTGSGTESPFLLPIFQAIAPLHLSVEASCKLHIHCVNFSTFPTLLALHAYHIFNSAVKVFIKQVWQHLKATAEKLHWIENQLAMAFTWEFTQVTWRSTSSLPFLVHISQLFVNLSE